MKNLLDPQISTLLELFADSGAAELYTLPPEQAREQYLLGIKKLSGKPPVIAKAIDRTIDGAGGPLSIRIYRPDDEQDNKLPVLVFFHGGGWSIGGLESHDHICRWLTAKSGCLLISVDYRLGPEHKFPAAVEDALTATQWTIQHATEIGADAGRLGLGGDSAGANLAAVVSIMMRDMGSSSIKTQLLIYPATDMTMSHPSHTAYGEGYRLTRPMMVWSVANYLREGRDMFDFRASPLLAKDHSNLPSALIMTASFDPLRDEGEAYAEKLRSSDVAVDYICYEGMIHGFIGMPGVVDAAKTALSYAAAYLKKQLG